MPSSSAAGVAARYAGFCSRPVDQVAIDLDRFVELLRRWQEAQNLVSRETLAAVWDRHISDSLQLLRLLGPKDRHVLDLGSGGGFPALPLAIASLGSDRQFTLVESNHRKVAFLRTVARELSLTVSVKSKRAEQIDSRETSSVDVVTSRAVASLDTLCSLSASLFTPSTRAIFHKGREYGEELQQAHAKWDFDVVVIPSDTSADGVLLELRHLRAIASA